MFEFVGWFCYGGFFYMSVSGGWFCVFIVGVLCWLGVWAGWMIPGLLLLVFFFFFLAMYVWRYLWILTFYLLDGV